MGLTAELLPHQFTLSKGYLQSLPKVGNKDIYAVLHGGGPAPGSNDAIHGVASMLISHKCVLIGFINGFKGAMAGHGVLLTRELIRGLEGKGGVALGTTRYSPKTDEDIRKFLALCVENKIKGTVLIGGDDTNTVAARTAKVAEKEFPGKVKIIGLTKTIDNDTTGEITYGFRTFVNEAKRLVVNLKADANAQDVPAAYIVEIMGRSSGALTLEIGKAAAASGIFIPEEFSLTGIKQIINSPKDQAVKDILLERIARMVQVNGETLKMKDFLDQVEALDKLSVKDQEKANSAIKLNAGGLANEIVNIMEARINMEGKDDGPTYGVFTIAEGLSGRFPTKIIEKDNKGNPVKFEVLGLSTPVTIGCDDFFNPRFADVQLAAHLMPLIKGCAADRGIKLKAVEKDIGYELRSADPDAFDINLAESEGELAAELLMKGISNVTVFAKANGEVSYISYDKLLKDERGHLIPRTVNLSSGLYWGGVNKWIYKTAKTIKHDEQNSTMGENSSSSTTDDNRKGT